MAINIEIRATRIESNKTLMVNKSEEDEDFLASDEGEVEGDVFGVVDVEVTTATFDFSLDFFSFEDFGRSGVDSLSCDGGGGVADF